ncbi:MAG: hypothetical protein QXX94_01725 [Candidatus Bathyarchaeia archaeon]
MESKKYRNFLEKEASKAPLEKKPSDLKERFWISWGESVDKATLEKGTSDIINSIYFGEDLSKTVVMDRKVARIIQERLKGLEEENIYLCKQIRIMKFIILGLILVISIMLIAILL